jgi:hypothetical protein
MILNLFGISKRINMGLRKLLEEKDRLQDELYMLHFAESSPELYLQKRSEIEYNIACVEEQIEFEEKFLPFRITLIVASVIMMGIMLYALIKS